MDAKSQLWVFNHSCWCSQRAFMKYRLPLREIVVDFYNELKSMTSGYASFDYEDSEYVLILSLFALVTVMQRP